MRDEITDSFLWQAKENYIKGITPANPSDFKKEEYSKLVEIGKAIFEKNGVLEFAGFFQESQYLISLWAAHILLEYAIINEDLRKECIEVIKEFSDFPLNERVAREETEWLILNKEM